MPKHPFLQNQENNAPTLSSVVTDSNQTDNTQHPFNDISNNAHSNLGKENKSFDEDGVMVGIQRYHYHRDRSYCQVDGKTSNRGTCTMRPFESEETCKVSLRFGVKEGPNGYIYLKQGCGHNLHSFHPKPQKGDLHFQKRHFLSKSSQLIASGGRASMGNGALQYIVLENQQELVSCGSIQRLQLDSTASQMVNWIRTNAADPNINLRYCFLSCTGINNSGYHRHPKGRPPQHGRIPIAQVEENMSFSDTLENMCRRGINSEEESHVLPIDDSDGGLQDSL